MIHRLHYMQKTNQRNGRPIAGNRFALLGAAGFVAPRHLRAIRDTGNELAVALDPHDSVGVLDRFFPGSAFFVEFERFDRHVYKLHRTGKAVDYVSVCSPNHLHDAHIRFGLRNGADVICEKPLVLNPWNLEALQSLEAETGSRVFNILQLRFHPAVLALKRKVDSAPRRAVFDLDLTYITSRGHWYYASWKGDTERSGGIATNIGIHFFDMLQWIFGPVEESAVFLHTHDRASGFLRLKKARVRWFLSINPDTLPEAVRTKGARTFRSIQIDGEELEFSSGFEDLHTCSYRAILEGRGFGLSEAAPAIEMAYHIRNASPQDPGRDAHPLAYLPEAPHPFKRREWIENKS